MGRGHSKAGGSMASFTAAVMNSPQTALNQLSKVIKHGQIDTASFTVNGSAVSSQYVTLNNGSDRIDIYFDSRFEPTQTTPPVKPIKVGIYATVWENGNAVAFRILTETKTKNLKNAKKNYDSVLDIWKKATKQKQITF
jgi:hypothetical protein